MLMLHNTDVVDLIEIIKEDMNEFKIYLKEQAVSYYSIEMTGQYVKLHPDIDIKSVKGFFNKKMKSQVKFKLDYALVNKAIFNREWAQQSLRSFASKTE